jgi:hypothetical protein
MTESPLDRPAPRTGRNGARRPPFWSPITWIQASEIQRLFKAAAVAGTVTAAVVCTPDTLATARMLPAQPLAFEANQGQSAAEVAYLARGPGYLLYLTPTEAVLDLPDAGTVGRVLRMGLVGAAAHPRITAMAPLPGKHNYYIGDDPARWRTDIPTYGEVAYAGVYPGIDLLYHGHNGMLEYDFHIAPGADPAAVGLRFTGADRLAVNGDGDLVITVGGAQVVHHAPYAYQTLGDTRHAVAARYVIHGEAVAFQVGDYDTGRPLVIDPALNYSSFLGGSSDDEAYAVKADDSGNIYLTGATRSQNFPGATTTSPQGGSDVFVTKLKHDGSVVWSTYLGTNGTDEPTGAEKGDAIAIDTQGNVYVTGGNAHTSSGVLSKFPTTPDAYHDCPLANSDAFAVRLDGTGAMTYGTCVGGGLNEEGLGIAVDGNGMIYVTGYTTSVTFTSSGSGVPFPTTSGALKTTVDQRSTANPNDQKNGFFFKLDPSKKDTAQLVYSTYVGGNDVDEARAIALDGSDNAYITGWTTSTAANNFPVTAGTAYQADKVGLALNGQDVFLLKLGSDPNVSAASNLKYGTFFGGSQDEEGNGIFVNSTGDKVYITGWTTTTEDPNTDTIVFPLKLAYQNSNNNTQDAFIAAFNPTITSPTTKAQLIFSTFLGGSGADIGNAITVDDNGRVYVTGSTTSADMLSQQLLGGTSIFGGGTDGFVASLNNTYTTVYYTAYLGGGGNDEGLGIAVDHGIPMGTGANTYVVGGTSSATFPVTTATAEQPTGAGGQDAFISIVGLAADVGLTSFTGTSPPPTLLQTLTYDMNITNTGPDAATNTTLKITLTTGGLNTPNFGGTNCNGNDPVTPTVITCNLGTLAVGQLVAVSISGLLTTAASMTATATVSADQQDNVSSNNALAWEVTASVSSHPVTPPTNVGGGGSSGGGGGGGGMAPLTLVLLAALTAGLLFMGRGRYAMMTPVAADRRRNLDLSRPARRPRITASPRRTHAG